MGRTGFEKVSQREYARRLGISNEAVSKAVREGRIKDGWNKKEGKIIVEKADREFGLLYKKTNVTEILETEPGKQPIPQQQQSATGSGGGTLQLTGNSTYGEARRVKEVIQAQLAALDLKERKGELVSRDEVFKKLYDFGQQMRTAFVSIPERHIDAIRGADTRHAAALILTDALYEVLEKLSKQDFDFKPRQ
jgi:hypothetical protein